MKNSCKSRKSYVLAIDPSGNFEEGKGTTGFALYDADENQIVNTWTVAAQDFDSQLAYWSDVIDLILEIVEDVGSDLAIVCEDYLLYGSKSSAQTNSRFETCQLIGVIKWIAYMNELPLYFQRAVDVKNRWSEEVLEHAGYIQCVGSNSKNYNHCHGYSDYVLHRFPESRLMSHELDAIKHAVHFVRFKNGK